MVFRGDGDEAICRVLPLTPSLLTPFPEDKHGGCGEKVSTMLQGSSVYQKH